MNLSTEACIWIATGVVFLYTGTVVLVHVHKYRKFKAEFLAEIMGLQGTRTQCNSENKIEVFSKSANFP